MYDKFNPARYGISTLHTRVEKWECDFNEHWNARYYSRSFQQAAEYVATLSGGENPGMSAFSQRSIRFHRELRAAAAVEVRSMRVADGVHAGATVHLLSSAGQLSAAAFDLSGVGAAHLPAVEASALALAMPRGDILVRGGAENLATDHLTLSGPVRPNELDHTGMILYEAIIARVGHGMYDKLHRMGFTPEFTEKTGIGRMAVQSAVRPVHASCPSGTILRVRSRLLQVGEKVFSTWHCLETINGQPVADVSHDVLAVDLNKRRAVPPPALLRAQAD